MNTLIPTIRLLGVDEPPAVFGQLAAIHQQAIPGGFLSTFPPPVLARLYKAMARSDLTFVVVAESTSKVIGFTCGSFDTGGFYREFLRKEAVAVLPMALKHLLSVDRLRRVAETLLYPARVSKTELPTAEILNFCVAQEARRLGLGALLFDGLTARFAAKGVHRIRIVTGSDQIDAHRFYTNRGARQVSQLEVHASHPSYIYVFDIPRTMPQ